MTRLRYEFDVTCLRCGADVEHVNDGRSIGSEAMVVCKCVKPGCRWDWTLNMLMRPVNGEIA